MHRFYITPEQGSHNPVLLSERESHHALNVLRLRQGERVVALDGAGHEYLCDVGLTQKHQVELAVAQKSNVPPLPYQITLLQAITKGKAMDAIIQKATELAVHRIVPILADRSVPQPGAEDSENKIEKWEATAIEAIKQCGGAWLPQIEAPVRTSAYLARNERFDLLLIATLQSDGRHPRIQIDSSIQERGKLPRTIGVWVGPEGDFTPAEINAIRNSGALPITLGQVVLRSETAAVYCLSVLNYEMQAPR